jgi:hypothetical protein
MLSYIYAGIIILFVIGLLVVGFVMDKEDVERKDD